MRKREISLSLSLRVYITAFAGQARGERGKRGGGREKEEREELGIPE